MPERNYFMENNEEAFRLEIKTDNHIVEKQASWAGIKPGMRVADIGCGAGKTTSVLYELAQPDGLAVGVDGSEKRIKHAISQYGVKGLDFFCKDILQPLEEFGEFDFIWVRFLLEYYKKESFDIVNNLSKILRPGGILCLIDLDYNCLTHYGLSPRLDKTISNAIKALETSANFDPYIGRKLYSFLFDLGYEDIDVDVGGHHLIFGDLKNRDEFNWFKKVEVVSGKIEYDFSDYKGGYEEFLEEFRKFFTDPRRFTYSPIVSCRGRKPMH
jgi:SAM-dependent methyltransferase